MNWTPQIRDFIAAHLNDDTAKLLFAAHRFPEVDMSFVVEQIEARKRLRTKLPEWYANPDLIMSGRIPAEQCSSEQTARFKRFVMGNDVHSLCDMTGGMGVDFWYMSRGLDHAIYTERQEALCFAARHNFSVLSAAEIAENPAAKKTEIEVREGYSTEMPVPDVDVIYLDPARRSTDGSRIYEIEDCEPNVIEWQDILLQHCRRLIVKVSPMADITRTIARMKDVSDIYVVSVRNECKELLIVQQKEASFIKVHCVDFLPQKTLSFDYDLSASYSHKYDGTAELGHYFYEPDVSIMKAQAFDPLMSQYDIFALDKDSHYFMSDELIEAFPGRIFEIDEIIDASSRQLKQLKRVVPQANIATRNFPLSPEELKKKTGIRDGGEVYLFGTTHREKGSILIRCHKVDHRN